MTFALVLLAGCAGAPSQGSVARQAEAARSEPMPEQRLIPSTSIAGAGAAKRPSRPAPIVGPDTAPDAVISIDLKTGEFSAEMDQRLRNIAQAAKKRDGIFVRLESYVPSRGSPAFDLGRAADVLQGVRERLQRLGISPRRILLAPYGSEYDDEVEQQGAWVEIYLLDFGAATLRESALTKSGASRASF